MSDRLGETLEAQTKVHASEAFKTATTQMRRELSGMGTETDPTNLNAILDRVYGWENENLDKVSQDEIEALQTLSLMLGMVKFSSEHAGKGPEAKLSVRKQNIEIEHDILRTVFSNLDEEGKPNEVISRAFSLVSSVFDEYFDPHTPRVTDKGAISNGAWVGAMGMVTASLMFNRAGWEIRIPPMELDLSYDTDLLVRNPSGEIFAVDVTAQTPASNKGYTNTDQLYSVSMGQADDRLKSVIPEVSGVIKVNVPPLMTREADSFYENRRTGLPNEKALDKFKSVIGTRI